MWILFLSKPVGDIGVLTSAYVMPHHFRLEHVQEEFNFATDEDITGSRRFRMIQLREDEVPGFKCQRVPAFDREIPEALFAVNYYFLIESRNWAFDKVFHNILYLFNVHLKLSTEGAKKKKKMKDNYTDVTPILLIQDYEKKIKDEEKLRKADDTDSHRVAVAKFMQQVRYNITEFFRISTFSAQFCAQLLHTPQVLCAVVHITVVHCTVVHCTHAHTVIHCAVVHMHSCTSQLYNYIYTFVHCTYIYICIHCVQ